jgi:hypothetical protein
VVDIHVMVDGLTRTTFEVGYLLQVADETRASAVTVHGAVGTDGRGRRLPGFLAELTGPGSGPDADHGTGGPSGRVTR